MLLAALQSPELFHSHTAPTAAHYVRHRLARISAHTESFLKFHSNGAHLFRPVGFRHDNHPPWRRRRLDCFVRAPAASWPALHKAFNGHHSAASVVAHLSRTLQPRTLNFCTVPGAAAAAGGPRAARLPQPAAAASAHLARSAPQMRPRSCEPCSAHERSAHEHFRASHAPAQQHGKLRAPPCQPGGLSHRAVHASRAGASGTGALAR